MEIKRGDIYWVQLGSPDGLEPRIPHPHVVIQVNRSAQHDHETVTVCALTSNLKRVNMPGSVLLEAGEANLPKQSVVEVSKVTTIDIRQLDEYIGSLSQERVDQIVAGMQFIQRSFFNHQP